MAGAKTVSNTNSRLAARRPGFKGFERFERFKRFTRSTFSVFRFPFTS
jgi:hypothetical protein